MSLRIIEATRALPQELFEAFGDPGIAKWVLSGDGKPGLAVELPDIYPGAEALAQHCLDEGLARLRKDYVPISIPKSQSTIHSALEILAKQHKRLSISPGQTVLSLRDSPICLRSLPGSLEIARRSLGPVELSMRSELRNWIVAVNADVRIARVLFDGSSLAFGARLPIPGPVDPLLLVAAVELAFSAIVTLERAVPQLTTVLHEDLAPVLSLIA